ncbi:MFS transporter [Halorarum halophilum]|uniref:MFS transporter n=1 Tax=Halorarum halophilum TaxID=2743090 RepID=A0A7D5KW93_9EURY|nr:MFS transporter [Halobaculum halophilum]QLG26278.1 MFS transporter [Halobaculum halophilum]
MTDRRDRVALATVVFAVMLAQTLVYPGVDLLAVELGGTGVAAPTLFLSVEFAAFVLFAGGWGALSDATSRRRPLVVAGAFGGAAGYLGLAVLPAATGLPFVGALLLRGLQGALTVGAFSLAMSALADLGGGNGRNMGAAGIAIGLGTAIGAPLGGQLYEVSVFWPLYAAAGLLAIAGLLALPVPDRAPSGGSERGLGALVRGLRERGDLVVPYAFAFVDRLTAGFFALVGTLYFREEFGLGPAETGLLLAAFFAPFALLQYPFGVLSDRVGRVVPVAVGSATFGLAVIAVGFAPTPTLAAVGMVAVGVLGALMAPATLALVVDLAGDDERGVAVAGFNAAGSLGFLAGSLVGGGVAATFGYLAAFGVAGGLEVLVALATLPALLRLGRRTGRTAVFGSGD